MNPRFKQSPMALAIAATFSVAAVATLPTTASAGEKGKYVAGDFHNHTTCSDGSISMQKLVSKATDKKDGTFGLDWFVQAGHGNSGGTRNCTLVEDDSLSTPAYPFIPGTGPNTTWTDSIGNYNVKGDKGATTGYMWRWQSVQEYQYPLIEYLNTLKGVPLFLGNESIVAGHEHASESIITGQIPSSLDPAKLPTSPGPLNLRYTPVGNANALAQWNYCFDRGDTDTSRGDITGTSIGNNWECSVPGSNSGSDPSWNATAQKLIPTGSGVGSNIGTLGHLKTVEGIKWMQAHHPGKAYYVPAHLERAGPFSPDDDKGYNIEHLRDFNNAAPDIAFGFETQPGHGASSNRGEYQVLRNSFPGVTGKVDTVGGTTYGGTGVYGAQIGGVWDALLGEGRGYYFFASSDWHNRGSFGPDDRRSTQDFYPGEYQRNYTLVKADKAGLLSTKDAKLTPQQIVDGLRSGNNFATGGQLIDRLSFVACATVAVREDRPTPVVEAAAFDAAKENAAIDLLGCATMGEKLVVRPGQDVVVGIVVRDPAGTNYSPYTFDNPSLLQIGQHVPMNQPVLDHIDLIRGLVTGYKTPGSPDYAGEWPRNTNWLRTDGTTADLSVVPAAAKNTSAAIIRTYNSANWTPVVDRADGTTYFKMGFRIPAVKASQYIRLRGTNLPPAVPFETDSNGNPLSDLFTNANDTTKLSIPCTTPHSAASQFDGCPDHLAVASGTSPIAGQLAVSYDVAAWADLWFYSNPIFIEVKGGTPVAGVK